MNNNLICDEENNKLCWACNENKNNFFIDYLDMEMMDEERDLVFALSKPSPLHTLLTVINNNATIFSSFPHPEGASFYHLTLNDEKEVLIVCYFSKKLNGWYD